MESNPLVLNLPLNTFILATIGLILLWGFSFLLLRSALFRKPDSGSEQERDWSIPTLDSQASRDSLFHRWDPRVRLASLVFFMFCVASLTQLVWAGLALVVAVASVGLARIPFRYPLRRLAAMGTFLGMFLVVMPITAPARSGDMLIVFEHVSFISFNLRGFFLALLICLKASAIALMVEPLVATSSFSVTVQALARLRVPAAVCQMLLLAYRYIYVFQDEVGRMVKGMSARGFRKRTDVETLRSIGNFLGMLMVRSFERTQRVHDAMLARGYDGAMPSTIGFQVRSADWVKGAFWVAAGIAILIADKACKIAPFTIF